MGAAGLEALLERERTLLDELVTLTREQHGILTREQADERELNASLVRRRKVLDELGPLFAQLESTPGAEPSRDKAREVIERVRQMDEQNLELCGGFMKTISGQARQMTQSRKVVKGYGKAAESTVETSGYFDKRQ